MNNNKIILDLCGGTGSWSKPYQVAGYDVKIITYPEYDVRTYIPPKNVYGILAAPPCTDFSIAGNRLWEEKDKNGKTIDSLSIVIGCLRIISMCNPGFWSMENPKGRFKQFMGEPQFKFKACDYGEPFVKLTYLWGKFNPPMPYMESIVSEIVPFDKADKYFKTLEKDYQAAHSKRAAKRSITPGIFAEMFYQANK